jgi:FkbM family methyltransferase
MDFAALSEIESIQINAEETTIVLKDGRQYLWNPDHQVLRLYTISSLGVFEKRETAFMRSLIKPGFTTFDIGANFGWYTVLLSILCQETGVVHAFEPVPRNFDILKNHSLRNNCRNVVLNNLAIGDKNGQGELYLPDIGSSGSFRLHKYKDSYQTISSSIITMNEYARQKNISKVDFIKADIEGAELDLLKGSSEILATQHNSVWMLEIQKKSTKLFGYEPVEVFELMRHYGFQAYSIREGGSLSRFLKYDEHLSDYNFVFARESRLSHLGVSITD